MISIARGIGFGLSVILGSLASEPDHNRIDTVVKLGSKLVQSVPEDVTQFGLSAYVIPRIAHELGHGYKLDEFGIPNRVGLRSGHTDYLLTNMTIDQRLLVSGAGPEAEQMLMIEATNHHFLTKKLSGYHIGTMARSLRNLYRVAEENPDGRDYFADMRIKRGSHNEKSRLKQSFYKQVIIHAAQIAMVEYDISIYPAMRTHLTENGVENYYDAHIQNGSSWNTSLYFREGHGVMGYGASGSFHQDNIYRAQFDYWKVGNREAYNYSFGCDGAVISIGPETDINVSVEVGHKSRGTLFGKPQGGGAYYSAGLSVKF